MKTKPLLAFRADVTIQRDTALARMDAITFRIAKRRDEIERLEAEYAGLASVYGAANAVLDNTPGGANSPVNVQGQRS